MIEGMTIHKSEYMIDTKEASPYSDISKKIV